ncbi:MAG TPA: N-acetylglucosamine-6-phosphate deacetylase [Planctomycetota bacterium]|nr:N-acetylglucosamine-6-phosphate deacetylase [Planctomycetota bacterium]
MRGPAPLVLRGARFLDGRIGDLHLADGLIARLAPPGTAPPPAARVIEADGLVAVPGFIDLHVHGGAGADFMDATDEAFARSAAYHAAGGTTAWMPTTATESLENILACVDAAARSREQRIGGIEMLGVHVEGPYMAPTKHGCHDPGFVRRPSPAENRAYLDRAPVIKRMTVAPEVPGVPEFIREAARAGIIPSGGHSEATIDQTLEAIDLGMSMITHLYSAMSTIVKQGPFRVPGMLEATLLDDRLATELIADLKHVSKDLLRLAMKAKAERSVCFVTDAMRGAGMPDGTYRFGSAVRGTPAVVEKGVARNLENTGFASSTVRMIDLVRNAVETVGLDLAAAVRRASLIPAVIAGVDGRKGALEPGRDADVVLLGTSPTLHVRATIARGEVIHHAPGL